MRYNFHSNKVEDCKLAIALNIVNGKYPIGEKIPHKKEIADEYNVKGIPTFIVYRDGKEVDRLPSRHAKTKEQIESFLSQV